MKCIFHGLEARVICLLSIDRQSVIYWTTHHLEARPYFDSNIQETTKGQVYPSDIASFPPLHERNEKKSRKS